VQEIIDVKDTAKSIIENDDLIRQIVEK